MTINKSQGQPVFASSELLTWLYVARALKVVVRGGAVRAARVFMSRTWLVVESRPPKKVSNCVCVADQCPIVLQPCVPGLETALSYLQVHLQAYWQLPVIVFRCLQSVHQICRSRVQHTQTAGACLRLLDQCDAGKLNNPPSCVLKLSVQLLQWQYTVPNVTIVANVPSSRS